MLQTSNVLLTASPTPSLPPAFIPCEGCSGRGGGGGERGQGKQVEKCDDLHSQKKKTKIILGGVEVEDSVVVRLGPVNRATQFHCASEIALGVKSFAAPDGGCRRNSRCWRRRCFVCFFLRPQIRDLA